MGFTLTSAPITIDQMSKVVTFFGYQELLSTGALDTTNTWTETLTGTGSQALDVYGKVGLYSGATSGGTSTIKLKRPFSGFWNNLNTNYSAFKNINMEWIAGLDGTITSIDESKFIMGFADNTSATFDKTGDTTGFCKNGAVWETICTKTGASETFTTTASTAINHLFKITMSDYAKYYIDGVLVKTNTSKRCHFVTPFFHMISNANPTTGIVFSHLRIWAELK